MLKFGLRQSFQKLEHIDERFSLLKVPVELAFPAHWPEYDLIRKDLPYILDKLKAFKTEVIGVHAVQAPITREGFIIWGKEIGDFAKALGVRNVTVHPNKVYNKSDSQKLALDNLKYLTDLYNGEVKFCVENFGEESRVFSPKEIVSFGLPMTLDTSHVGNNKDAWELLKTYKDNIFTVHLSARAGKKKHQPVDAFCMEIVKYLRESKWPGNIILEYLPEFRGQMLKDLELVKNT